MIDVSLLTHRQSPTGAFRQDSQMLDNQRIQGRAGRAI
jgi:hypothetical protein